MFKSSNPNSVGYRKPKFLYTNDPRAVDSATFEKFRSNAGAEVIVKPVDTNFIELEEYVPVTSSAQSRGTSYITFRTGGSTWANQGNLIDGVVGDSNTTYSFTTGMGPNQTAYAQVYGYGFSSSLASLGLTAEITSVDVRITHRIIGFSSTFTSITLQPYIGSTALLTTQNLTKSNAVTTDTKSFTGLTLDQIKDSNFGFRYTATANATNTSNPSVYYIDVTVNYTVY